MGYLDKLSTVTNYGPYKSKQLTCRAETTPDALAAVKVMFTFVILIICIRTESA